MGTCHVRARGVVLLGVTVWSAFPDENPQTESDPREFSLTQRRLRELKVEFDRLDIAGTPRARPATVHGCSTDSGEVLQPFVVRTWAVRKTETKEIARSIADALVALGWSGEAVPDQFDRYLLRSEREGWNATVVAWYDTFDGKTEVFIQSRVQDARPCRLK